MFGGNSFHPYFNIYSIVYEFSPFDFLFFFSNEHKNPIELQHFNSKPVAVQYV